MKTTLKTMQMRKNGIPENILPIFEDIVQAYSGNECDGKFMKAMEEHLTEEQRFRIWEQNGGCRGTGYDKARKAFATEHANKPLSERLELFLSKARSSKLRDIVLDEGNKTISVTFACDECYKHILKGKLTTPYKMQYERCAGGRLYTLQKALGIKLKIKSVDIPPQGISIETPCVFTFEIAD